MAHRSQISTALTDQHPTGYIISNADDLITLFDADCGVLVIGEGAKILGQARSAEYLRIKQFTYAIYSE